VVADSLRADRLSAAGCPRATSPFLDALAARGVLFERAFTPVSPTRPAIATLLSGQHPITHGIVGKRTPRRPRPAMTSLPERLLQEGWETLAIDGMARRRASPWLRRGFTTSIALGGNGSRPRAFDFNRELRRWLRARGPCTERRPFFALVRYCDTHTPYLPPRAYRHLYYEGDPTIRNVGSLERFWQRPHKHYFIDEWARPLRDEWPHARGPRVEDADFLRAMYDASVRVVDDGVAEIAAALQDLRALDDTTLVVTADHGESLGEHGVLFGHVGLHDPVLRVPCIVAGAGVTAAGRRVAAQVQTTDLAPTLLELAGVADADRGRGAGDGGLDVHDELDGRSLAPWLRGREPDAARRRTRLLACEATYRACWALRTETHKLIVSREPGGATELYDLRRDPGETDNLAQPALQSALAAELEELLARAFAARGREQDPVVAALASVHGHRAKAGSTWRSMRRALRHGWRDAAATAPRLAQLAHSWLRPNGSRRPDATAQTT